MRIRPDHGFGDVRRAALAFAREVERRIPDDVTTTWWRKDRDPEAVFVDYNQNARDHTIAAAYSVRGNDIGTVSTPFRWDELDDVEPNDLTIATVPQRFAELGDLHAGIDDAVFDITPAAGVGRARRGRRRRTAARARGRLGDTLMDLVVPPGPGVPQGLTVPGDVLVERFSRSSGPGGQGVNTADSRVELELDVVGVRRFHRHPAHPRAACPRPPAGRGSAARRRGVRAPAAAAQPVCGPRADGRAAARRDGSPAGAPPRHPTHEGFQGAAARRQEAARRDEGGALAPGIRRLIGTGGTGEAGPGV